MKVKDNRSTVHCVRGSLQINSLVAGSRMDIKKVLVADAVDSACTDLLKKHGIQVDCKYKLPKDQLIKEIPVCNEEELV